MDFWTVEINQQDGLVVDVMEALPDKLQHLVSPWLANAPANRRFELWVNPHGPYEQVIKHTLVWAVPERCKNARPCVKLADKLVDMAKFCSSLEG